MKLTQPLLQDTYYHCFLFQHKSCNVCPASRVALASSTDGLKWTRLGRLIFEPFQQPEVRGIDPNLLDNKDAKIFPIKFGNTYVSIQRFTFARDIQKNSGIKTGMWFA